MANNKSSALLLLVTRGKRKYLTQDEGRTVVERNYGINLESLSHPNDWFWENQQIVDSIRAEQQLIIDMMLVSAWNWASGY